MAKYDYLIVGSGLFGATIAYRAVAQGKKVLGYREAAAYGRKHLL